VQPFRVVQPPAELDVEPQRGTGRLHVDRGEVGVVTKQQHQVGQPAEHEVPVLGDPLELPAAADRDPDSAAGRRHPLRSVVGHHAIRVGPQVPLLSAIVGHASQRVTAHLRASAVTFEVRHPHRGGPGADEGNAVHPHRAKGPAEFPRQAAVNSGLGQTAERLVHDEDDIAVAVHEREGEWLHGRGRMTATKVTALGVKGIEVQVQHVRLLTATSFPL